MATPENGRRTKIRARDVFESYFLKHHREDLKAILEAKEDVEMHYPVFVNFLTMFEEHPEVAESLLTSPTKLLPVMDVALFRAFTKLLAELKDTGCGAELTLKTNLHARITGLPSCPELYRDQVPRTADVGRLLCVAGTVVRRTSTKMLEFQKEFMCTKCRHVFTVVADHDQYYHLSRPGRCPNPQDCHSFNFNVLSSTSKPIHTKDYQELKIQEQVQKLKMGSIPGSLWVTVEDDLVDSCRPGDDVVICGVVRQRWRPVTRGVRPSLDLVLRANNVTVDNKELSSSTTLTEEMREEFADFWDRYRRDPMAGRNVILASFCPQVYGLYVVKLAVAVVVAGGVQRTSNNTRVRGEAHLLLVGDPGTAKSQFLKYTSALVPRSVFTTGAGTTSTGLTVTVVREEGEWALEAGALVMADGGVCCIDEFNSMKEADRAAIHEAMEQQTISVAKAGLLCKLDSRCSVLAATNPKMECNAEEMIEFVGLASPLLSRFDLVLVLKDARNHEWDRVVSGYILKGQDPGEAEGTGADEDWSLEKLRAYFCLIRSLQPRMTPQANEVLSRYYQVQRQRDLRSKARTTLRLLESLVRLSQGHARLLMRDTVEVQDAVVAISLLEASMGGFSAVMDINPLYTAFPLDARQEYRTQVQVVLEKLSLPHVLEEELARLDEEDEHIASSRKLTGTCKKRGPSSGPVTSTQKLPSTAALHSRRDFKPSVNEEALVLDIEELNETATHRKRPRGAQQTLSRWVEQDTTREMESSLLPLSDDDLELVKPRKQRKRKEKERGKSVEPQGKNVKRRKVKKSAGVETSRDAGDVMPSASTSCSVSHVERAGEELLQDLDDFAEDAWTPTKARERFSSTVAKFAYKKPGKETNTKQSCGRETSAGEGENGRPTEGLATCNPEPERKKTAGDGNSRNAANKHRQNRPTQTHSPLTEKPPANSDSRDTQQRNVSSDLEPISKASRERKKPHESDLASSLSRPRKGQTQNHSAVTPSRESGFSMLKRFAYSPPEDEPTSVSPPQTSPGAFPQITKRHRDGKSDSVCAEGKDLTSQTLNPEIQVDSTTESVNLSDNREDRRSKDILSLTHTRIKEAQVKRMSIDKAKNQKDVMCPLEMQDFEEDEMSPPLRQSALSDTGIKENGEADLRMRENGRGSATSERYTSSSEIRENHKESNQPSGDTRDRDQPFNAWMMKENGRGSTASSGIEKGMNRTTSNVEIREDNMESNQPSSNSISRKTENGGDRNYPERQNSSPGTRKLIDKPDIKLNTLTDSPILTKASILNTPPPSSASSSKSYFSSSGPRQSKLKRFCFALNDEDEDDMDLFDSPLEGKVIERERKDVRCENVTTTTTTTTSTTFTSPITTTTTTSRQPSQAPFPNNLFPPSSATGRLKLPIVAKGVDKYRALASDELDDFDFDL